MDEQLPILRRLWAGESLSDELGPIGPLPARPGGPELLIGGYVPASQLRRGHGLATGRLFYYQVPATAKEIKAQCANVSMDDDTNSEGAW